ncbi:unnamed protein product [Brassica napus]|uniref:(rape) hypothetical protein n=1 Tax=Brassica napus TaxID=3708 RepID=A0A816J4N5_BRANA|nr:unnamed protein product [Brassica napus]
MALKLCSSSSSPSLFFQSSRRSSSSSLNPIRSKPATRSPSYFPGFRCVSPARLPSFKVSVAAESPTSTTTEADDWGKVSAVLFDMDGVLCNSEDLSRRAAVDVFTEMGVEVTVDDFVPFMGTGEAKFLGGVASVKGVQGFDPDAAKKRFFEIYLDKYAKPESGIGFPGALELVTECKNRGLKVAVASSADRVKVDANLAAAGLSLSMFDAIVSADAFENLKPAPDIFLAASKILGVPTSECIVIEDALAGVQAAQAANMRCIAVKTTLSEAILKDAGPSIIRDDIGNISINDILTGGSDSTRKQHQENTASDKTNNNGFQGSRRDILRYGSLGIALSCVYFAANNWKAMQYASPQALWNALVGTKSPSFTQNQGEGRVQQFVDYIADLESKQTATTVPEFPSKLDWLNTAPLQFRRDLKGKVVVLDFWTYCCINCMHVLPDLEFLEKKYADKPFTVVGVHSAKFDNEKDSEAIRSAVLRYDISHPVVNDGDMYMWRELGINSWPTFAVVSPNGKVIAQIAGESHRKDLDDLVTAALIYYGGKNVLDSTPLPTRLEKDNDPRLAASPLKFPGKLAIDTLNNRLFISDSNHNRIIVTDLDGNFIVQIGSTGEEGFRDGSFEDAAFNRPQGLAYNAKKNILYVADTENHALREIDFVNERVETLAGNGTKGSDYQGGRKGTSQARNLIPRMFLIILRDQRLLNSPWDICYEPVKEKVYVAMAGQHQIWEYNVLDGVTKVFSGNGYERNLNGSTPQTISFAQPSGISLGPDLKEAYIADSESSSIRALDLQTGGSRLLAGGDPYFSENLFKFGDNDGVGAEVLLQHPLGVLCAKDGQIYLADSYNHKIKKLDPVTKRVVTIAGTGKAGFKDGKVMVAQLSEPAGLALTENGRLFVADTNNSLIRYIDLNNKEDVEIRTLELKGVQPPMPKAKSLKRLRKRASADTKIVTVDAVTSREGDLNLKILLPDGYHFSKEAPSKFVVDVEPEDAVTVDPLEGLLGPEGSTVLHYRQSSTSASIGKISCKVFYCKEDEVCLYQSVQFEEIDSLGREIKALKPKVEDLFLSSSGVNSTKKNIFFIYLLVSLGLAYHFEAEIEENLKEGFQMIEEMLSGEDDLHTVSIIFWVFRTYGHNVSSDVFRRFKGDNGKFKEYLTEDAKGILSLYEAAHMGTMRDYILDEALSFAMSCLETLVATGTCQPHLSRRIQNALGQPQHKNAEILVAREYIRFYEQEEDSDKTLLKFSKLNFKFLQLQYLQELKDLSKWYKEKEFEYKLPPYYRDRLVELHLVTLPFFEPKYSRVRIMVTKLFVVQIILDDTCDRYASLREVESLGNAIERWDLDDAMDGQPDYLKFVVKHIFDTFQEFEREVASELGGSYSLKATIDAEYLEVAGVEVAVDFTIAGVLMAMKDICKKEAYEWLKSGDKLVIAMYTVTRVLNDIHGYEDDMSRGYVTNSINCYKKQYGVTEKEAFEKLHQIIANANKMINEELLKPANMPRQIIKEMLNYQRITNVSYEIGDEFTRPGGKLKSHVTSMYLDL